MEHSVGVLLTPGPGGDTAGASLQVQAMNSWKKGGPIPTMPTTGGEVSVKSSVCRVEDSSTGRHLEARVSEMGKDLVVAVGGGERPHVGSIVLAQPVPSKHPGKTWSVSCSVLTIPPHKEEPIARGIATTLAEALGRVVVVTAGVHDDGLDADGIACYLRLGERLGAELARRLGNNGGTA
jgi:hypothetical protein